MAHWPLTVTSGTTPQRADSKLSWPHLFRFLSLWGRGQTTLIGIRSWFYRNINKQQRLNVAICHCPSPILTILEPHTLRAYNHFLSFPFISPFTLSSCIFFSQSFLLFSNSFSSPLPNFLTLISHFAHSCTTTRQWNMMILQRALAITWVAYSLTNPNSKSLYKHIMMWPLSSSSKHNPPSSRVSSPESPPLKPIPFHLALAWSSPKPAAMKQDNLAKGQYVCRRSQ